MPPGSRVIKKSVWVGGGELRMLVHIVNECGEVPMKGNQEQRMRQGSGGKHERKRARNKGVMMDEWMMGVG